DERNSKERTALRAHLPLPREIQREEGQHEHGGVAQQRDLGEPFESGPDGETGTERTGEDDREFFTAPRSSGFLTATDTGEDELLPQPVGVLLGELSGDLVETTHSADRDEEC